MPWSQPDVGLLEEVATEKDKEYIQNSIKFVQEQLEK